jgi:D-3-phosphoglycerate dehydrogenase
VMLNGVPIDAQLPGTTILFANNDQPGVIGQIGTILGQHNVNIANFALGRSESGAVAAVNVDEPADTKIGENVLDEIRKLKSVKDAWLVRV